MLVTEREARSKTCCGPRLAALVNPAKDSFNCIASVCMAWRWKPGENKELGYCGLAGPSEVKA